MYKKSVHIFLVIWLLVITTGYTVSRHYCGGDFINLAVNAEAEPCCGEGGCCHIETEFYQLDEDFTGPVFWENIQNEDTDQLFWTLSVLVVNELNLTNKEIINYAEPPPCTDLSSQLSLFQSYLC